ncbi:alpha/beta fold hydrolase [Humibacillus xanthopallidus]|uniref:alpha/beta fold hydrolase n=1 Tax=Humibacillus xanthopallidus TaxID=412689 RepID=UPI00163A2C7D|nr:alpha/beta hydrolase [Humibacillus xanthopallidus]
MLVVAALVLGACTTASSGDPNRASGAAGTAATAPRGASTTVEPERDVVVAGHHVKARCAGSGPSVILVTDYARSMDDVWQEIQSRLAAQGRVCAYDRLGVGRSDAAPDRQTFTSMAGDLEGVISALGLTRPVVVMGHALGGPIALSWASKHQADARALVLFDPMPPGYLGPKGSLVKALPPPDPGDPELSNVWRDVERFNDQRTNKESLDPESWTAYERLPAMSVPLYILLEAWPQQWPAAVDAKKVDATWRGLQRGLLALSTPSEQVSVPTQDAWPTVIENTLRRALMS